MKGLSIEKDIADSIKDMLGCDYMKEDFDNADDKNLISIMSKIIDLLSSIVGKLL